MIKYARDQLLYFPLSNRAFVEKLNEAVRIFKMLIDKQDIGYTMPISMERLMKDEAPEHL